MSIPSVGSKVKIVTRHHNLSFWHNETYEDNILVGEILPNAKWLTKEQLTISNKSIPCGFSVVSINKIVEMNLSDGTKIELPSIDIDFKQWKVSGSKGDVYTVIRKNNIYSCDCQGFQFRKNCKHIEKVIG